MTDTIPPEWSVQDLKRVAHLYKWFPQTDQLLIVLATRRAHLLAGAEMDSRAYLHRPIGSPSDHDVPKEGRDWGCWCEPVIIRNEELLWTHPETLVRRLVGTGLGPQ